jgi:uncharacterized RDD family membrane protein YckC
LLPVNDATTMQAWVPGEPWRRILASLVDSLCYLPMAIALVPATEIALKWQSTAPIVATSVLWWFLNLWLILRIQGSPGKRLLGLRIMRIDGAKLGWLDAINRQILYICLSGFLIHQQGVILADLPPGTTLESYVKLTPQGSSSMFWVVDAGLALLWASCLLIMLRPDRRALYDLWSGTVVVRQLKPKPLAAT